MHMKCEVRSIYRFLPPKPEPKTTRNTCQVRVKYQKPHGEYYYRAHQNQGSKQCQYTRAGQNRSRRASFLSTNMNALAIVCELHVEPFFVEQIRKALVAAKMLKRVRHPYQ